MPPAGRCHMSPTALRSSVLARSVRYAISLTKEAKEVSDGLVARLLQGAINRDAFEGYPLARPIEHAVENGAAIGPEEGVEGERHTPVAVIRQNDVVDVVGGGSPFKVDTG